MLNQIARVAPHHRVDDGNVYLLEEGLNELECYKRLEAELPMGLLDQPPEPVI